MNFAMEILNIYTWIIVLHFGDVFGKYVKPITIGTIVPLDNMYKFSIERVKPAFDIAVQKVRDEMQLLTDRNITILYADSKCSVSNGLNEAIDFYFKSEVDIFFGPCCDYAAAPVGRQIRFWNIAMMTPGAYAADFAVKDKMFGYITRVGSTVNSLIRFVSNILQRFNWQKLNIIYDPAGQDNISERLCHVVAEGMHYGIIPHPPYHKFEADDTFFDSFADVIGKEIAGK